MKFSKILGFTCVVFTPFAPIASAQDTIEATKSKLEQWVETRQIISKEQSDWKADQTFLTETQTLLQTELEALSEQSKELEDSNTVADEERNNLLLKRAEFLRSNTFLEEEVVKMEQDIRTLIKRFPDPLQHKLQTLIVRIPENPKKTKLSLGQRMQSIVGILAQAEKFDKTATFTGETRKLGGGQEVQVNTLYWGLALAYYCDSNGTKAGVGVPGDDGWVWTENNAVAPEVKRFMDIYEGNTDEIDFINLPVAIK